MGWQSLLSGRELLSLSLRWHVGDGSSIFYKENVWISSLFPCAPRPIQGHNPKVTRVCQLLNPRHIFGIYALLRENFNQQDIQHILSIPVSMFLMEDFLAWH
ncbi:hypothetical protein MANES_03G145577v8 [Manihot esculenta]|uniref:Uncharacterized protein n=1 Tax=Manihot esculenta TaxID=3983 RepID=A0ACB7I0Q1_MANES|nr:hypothetical protein MANES_03G145577v8 [Manihot esculenta]